MNISVPRSTKGRSEKPTALHHNYLAKNHINKKTNPYKQKILLSYSNKNPKSGGIFSFPGSKQSDTTCFSCSPSPVHPCVAPHACILNSYALLSMEGIISCRTGENHPQSVLRPSLCHYIWMVSWWYHVWIRKGIACNFCWFFSYTFPYLSKTLWSTLFLVLTSPSLHIVCSLQLRIYVCIYLFVCLFGVFSTKPSTTWICFLIKAQTVQ